MTVWHNGTHCGFAEPIKFHQLNITIISLDQGQSHIIHAVYGLKSEKMKFSLIVNSDTMLEPLKYIFIILCVSWSHLINAILIT